MPKVSPIQNAFTSGEVSSLLYGRTDLESNKTSMRLCKNQIPVIQGPVVRRPGTLDGGEVKDSTRLTITVSFRYSSTDSYDIEVGHLYMRFGRDMAPVVLPAQAISAVSTAAQAVLTYAGADSFSNGDDGEISGSFCIRTEEDDDPDQDPVILLHCAEGALTIENDLVATITLAHELGHHESWLRSDCADDVYAIMMDDDGNADAPEALRRAWLEEEERAWRYGRALLREVIPDFPAFDLFDRMALDEIDGPAGYRIGLGF